MSRMYKDMQGWSYLYATVNGRGGLSFSPVFLGSLVTENPASRGRIHRYT